MSKLKRAWVFFWWWLIYHGNENPVKLWKESRQLDRDVEDFNKEWRL